MSWNWVSFMDSSFLSPTGWNCHVVKDTNSPTQHFLIVRFGGQEVTRKYFKTKEEAHAAMLEFVARCDGEKMSSQAVINFPARIVGLEIG